MQQQRGKSNQQAENDDISFRLVGDLQSAGINVS